MAEGKRLRAVLLPPTPWQPEIDAFRPGEAPNPLELIEGFTANGIDLVNYDPGTGLLNPFAKHSTLLQGADILRALRVMLTERQADLVISIHEGGAVPLVLLRRLMGFGVPIVLWDVGLTEEWKLRERILGLLIPRVEGICVLSESQKPYIKARWGRETGVANILQHVDTKFWMPTPVPPNAPLLTVGEDVGRDFATFLNAVDGLDADIVAKTRKISPAEAVRHPRLQVIQERLDFRAFRTLYEQSRFVVIPLRPVLNPSGVTAILEAGAAGRALVVSDIDAIRDFIVPGETCLTVPPGDAGAMRAAIQRLLDEPETCARLGVNGRRFMEENFSRPVFMARFATVLKGFVRHPAN